MALFKTYNNAAFKTRKVVKLSQGLKKCYFNVYVTDLFLFYSEYELKCK